jgi:hypothetical protein
MNKFQTDAHHKRKYGAKYIHVWFYMDMVSSHKHFSMLQLNLLDINVFCVKVTFLSVPATAIDTNHALS